jgi:hypothetical protein
MESLCYDGGEDEKEELYYYLINIIMQPQLASQGHHKTSHTQK